VFTTACVATGVPRLESESSVSTDGAGAAGDIAVAVVASAVDVAAATPATSPALAAVAGAAGVACKPLRAGATTRKSDRTVARWTLICARIHRMDGKGGSCDLRAIMEWGA